MEKIQSFRLSQPQFKKLQAIKKRLQAKNTSETIRILIEHADDKKLQKLMTAVVEKRELDRKMNTQIRRFNQLGSNLNQLIRLTHTYDEFNQELFDKLKINIDEIKLNLLLIKDKLEK